MDKKPKITYKKKAFPVHPVLPGRSLEPQQIRKDAQHLFLNCVLFLPTNEPIIVNMRVQGYVTTWPADREQLRGATY